MSDENPDENQILALVQSMPNNFHGMFTSLCVQPNLTL